MVFAGIAHAQQTRTLRIGGQSVTLTSDKRSSPALVVQMPAGDIWYGFLTPGTAPGRLTLRMPSSGQWPNQVFSLTAPLSYHLSFSTISADFPQVYTWNGGQHGLPDSYNGTNVHLFNSTTYNANLTTHGVYPTYWIQAICSTTAGSWLQLGNPIHAGNGMQCWCRLKRRTDDANGGWVFAQPGSTAISCANACPNACAFFAAGNVSFRTALLNAFANP